MSNKPTIVVAGASGFIGRWFIHQFKDRYNFIALSRSEVTQTGSDHIEWRKTDLYSLSSTLEAVRGADFALYLVHSMQPSTRLNQGSFEDTDLILADNFARAAEQCGIKQIVFVGGIIPQREVEFSRHLQSRYETELQLASGQVPVTTLRAGIIIGPGGSSFNIVKSLVNSLSIMACPKWCQSLHLFNNTLLGRMFLGPVLSQIAFMRADIRLILAGDRRVALGWLLHVPSLFVAYVMVVLVADVPVWLWVVASYLSMAILKIRTFLEHRTHDHPRGRSVVVEDRGLLSFLFLNNNFHSVHHAPPSVPWYALPCLFASKRDRFLAMNDGYHFGGYGEVMRKFAINRKDPVAHPNWSQKTVD